MSLDGESGCTVHAMRTRVLALAVLTAGLALVGGETAHAYPTDRATPDAFQPARPDLGPGRGFSVCYPLQEASPSLGRRECFLYYAETGQLIPGSGVVAVFDQGPDVAADAGPQGAAAAQTTAAAPALTTPAPASPRVAPVAPAAPSPAPVQATTTAPETPLVAETSETAVISAEPSESVVGSTAVRPVARPYASPAAADRWTSRPELWVALVAGLVLAYCLVKKPVPEVAGRHRKA